jgi:hypothetical protein
MPGFWVENNKGFKKMNTAFLLMAQYQKAILPLSDICVAYFGCAKHTADQKAKAGTLPVPAFKCGTGQKGPYMVSINDLAQLIDERREAAKADWVGN